MTGFVVTALLALAGMYYSLGKANVYVRISLALSARCCELCLFKDTDRSCTDGYSSACLQCEAVFRK